MKIKYIINFNQRINCKNHNLCTEYIKVFKPNPEIKRKRTEVKPKYIINFNQMTKLKKSKLLYRIY